MGDRRKNEVELQAALRENQRLREENAQLRELLAAHPPSPAEAQAEKVQRQISLPDPIAVAAVVGPADKAAKVALFRALFPGREDVYAIRWRMKDGTWGYRPDDKKDWNAVLASRPEDRKKVHQQTRTFFSLTDAVVRQHLEGKKDRRRLSVADRRNLLVPRSRF